MGAPIWKLPRRDPDAELTLARELGISTVMAALLRNRGFDSLPPARAFLKPRLTDLEDPSVIHDMDRGADRLRDAIRKGERIVVYGDYDVDGMTGSVVLLNFIKLAGGRGEAYIPNRLSEGYSFSESAVEAFIASAERPGLVITVDHGISATAGIARLAEAGIDVVVTDHHEPPPELPTAARALVNPRHPDCTSRFKDLCGAAVAFKLAWAAARSFTGQRKLSPEFRDFLLEAMALVALATISDVVPLVGENRILCYHGLRALAVSKNPGIRALLRNSRLKGQVVRAVHVGFRLGPRLNAAGRMGIAEVAIELLTTDDEARARALADQLEDANDRRRAIEREILEEALALPEVADFSADHGLCLGSPKWHAGVIGIVASRLTERYNVPVLLAALNGDRGRGSARTAGSIHLRDVLAACSDHMVSFGGHAGAAGCTVTEAAFPGLAEAFVNETRAALATADTTPVLDVDLELPFRQIRSALVEELELLAPHGAANPPALFVTRGVQVAGNPRVMGRTREHLAFHAREGSTSYRAIAFGMGERREEIRKAGFVDICYRLKFDTYRDPGAVELEIEDLRPADSA